MIAGMPDKKTLKISKKQARRIALWATGLNAAKPFGLGKKGVLTALKRLSYVQIDTISVVERAHHHVLKTRVPNYRSDHLHELISKDKLVFEYWSHAAAYLPIEDYRYSFVLKQFFKDKKDRWPKPEQALIDKVYERVKKEGPLMARHFEDIRPDKGGWWNLKPAKWALDRLFLEGDLVVRERKGFQKVYDLPERVIPGHIDQTSPSNAEFARYLIDRALTAHGIMTVPEIAYLRKGMRRLVAEEVIKMKKEGILSSVEILRIPDKEYLVKTNDFHAASIRINKSIRILSPFDNATIQRSRLKDLFDFDYQIECYVPKMKRKYGYFSLPILFGDTFIGRMDAKADRKESVFKIVHLHLETLKTFNKVGMESFVKAIKDFAQFNGCTRIQFLRSSPATIKNILVDYLES